VDDSFATIGTPGVQAIVTVLVLTGLPAVGGLLSHVTPLKREGLIFSAPNNSMAPNAPFIGTERVAGLALLAIESVAVSSFV
jgi:hypothetical protein